MIVELPRGIEVCLDDIPDDFDEQVKESFRAYSEMTSREYRDEDRLAYIDLCVKKLREVEAPCEEVRKIIYGRIDSCLDEDGEMPEKSEFTSVEFMEDCYGKGEQNAKLHGRYREKLSQEDSKIMALLCRVIRVVMAYDE